MAENEALKAAMEETASRTECRVYICFALFVVILFLVDKLLATTKKARPKQHHKQSTATAILDSMHTRGY
ncbi:hypothetical protein N0V91_004148 [Didymella pomorum]|uniref:Uncharacterized protein n=1 Tax=Didymella pomorum TaxID=749634 RepID=A0A9W8ZGV9_9PLEO|nr:hypothetical protein N0V91_004148 [Didymella pomorum]